MTTKLDNTNLSCTEVIRLRLRIHIWHIYMQLEHIIILVSKKLSKNWIDVGMTSILQKYRNKVGMNSDTHITLH